MNSTNKAQSSTRTGKATSDTGPARKTGTQLASQRKPAPAKSAGKAVKVSEAAAGGGQAAERKQPPPRKPKAGPVAKLKADKPRKLKLVRDSYTIPEDEYAVLGELKKRLLTMGIAIKKSELLRAGVALLVALGDDDLKGAAQRVEVIKTGRPAKTAK